MKSQMFDTKNTSNAAWWIKEPKKNGRQFSEQSWSTKFSQDMTDLFQNISLHGYNKLLDRDLFFYEKFIWLCLHLTTFTCVTIVLSQYWDQFVAQYFAITLHDPLYPIENVAFPAVSVCSNNRISLLAAENYADTLSNNDPLNRSRAHFLEGIGYLNSMYYKYERSDNFEEYAIFQSFLDNYGTSDNETFYNILKTMRELTPLCEQFILKCSLGGKEIDCFSKKAFQRLLTMYGLCCVFNAENSYHHRTFEKRFVSSDLGLTVILNTSRADNFKTLLNIDGYVVIVHNPLNYPDIASGSSLEVFPMAQEESFISVKARIMDTSHELRSFSPLFRKCFFDNEATDTDLYMGRNYTFANCITRCRSHSIMALCNCIPFYIPLEILQTLDGMVYCTLDHVECLQRYTFKWRNVLTKRINIRGLERELEDGLYCPQCLPSCDDRQYDISLMSLPTDHFRARENIGDDYNLKTEDMSVLRVYFGEASALYYRRVVGNTWVEALSTAGNVVSIFMGFSFVAILEILFFIIKYLKVALQNMKHFENINENRLHKRKQKQDKNHVTTLYILP